MNVDIESKLEELKAEFKDIEFAAGTHGFSIRKGTQQMVFSYALFNDPNYMNVIINHVTMLQTVPRDMNLAS